MNTNDPIFKVVQDLRDRGFTHTFNIQYSGIYCPELSREIAPEDLTIVEQHHIDGEKADSSNTHEVFAVETQDHVMGIMLDTYAQYNAAEFASIFNKVHKSNPGMA